MEQTKEQNEEISDGMSIRFKKPYAKNNEVFIVKNWDGKRGFASDKDGMGWYFTASQVEEVEEDEDEEDEDEEDEDEEDD